EEDLSFINLVQEVFPPQSVTAYYYAKPLAIFVEKLMHQMQKMPQAFSNTQILTAEKVLLELINPTLLSGE
ncbi:MAG: hypothetical protein J6Y94_08160, partial [Bacteriovoracaceae bacterium]|nr:hypothetical protein [Bacteriovoracaceae bacterium]